ncbi:hypothetical protein V6N11_076255 [Hibiscus sabdariffa]|uniref:Uncharacterized protein n=1 Tax=Hibiscus sabdariffa TaxID=183260 RepID=A0ABR2Q5Q2_9ROSI
MVEPSPTTPVDLLRDSAKEQEELEWTNRKEAHLSLEVGETVGFRFNEERPVVIRSLESLENDAERGFGKAEKRHAIKNLVKKFRINFLFIQETKLEIVEAKIAKFIGVHKNRSISWVWRDILNPEAKHSDENDTFIFNISYQVGNGRTLDFWNDKWVNGQCLRNTYHRVYALATRKTEKIADFGTWDDSVWRWEVRLRRPPFNWN